MQLFGYRMNKEGRYGSPAKIEFIEGVKEDALKTFIAVNVPKHYEIRIVDKDDMCIIHIVDQVLIFPIPPHGSKNNKWDSKTQKFEDIRISEVHGPASNDGGPTLVK